MKKVIWSLIISVLIWGIGSAQDDIEMIAFGTSYIGEFTNDESSLTLGFDGNAGDIIYIVALDNLVAVEFTLISPSGGQLAQSDNTLIRNIELATNGRYTIELVRPAWDDREGEFTLHLGHYAIEQFDEEDDEGTTLITEGILDDAGALRQYEATFEAGDLATMMLFGGNVSLAIQASNDELMLFEGGYDDPEIGLFQFPMTDIYTFTIQTIEPQGTEIWFELYQHEPITVAVNEPVVGELTEGLPAVFAFESPADKMWDINATVPDNGESLMAIYDFGDHAYWESVINVDEGSGPDGQPRIQPFIPSNNDTYYVALWYDDWDTEYEDYPYQLIISPSTLLSIPNNSPLTGQINNETGNAQYAYRGKAGDMITVTLTQLSKDGVLSLGIYSAEDEVVTFTGRNANRAQFDVVLPLDGIYEFVIGNASYDETSTLEYEVLVEPVVADS